MSVGQGRHVNDEYETLRWPTNMDRSAIVARLVQIRDSALEAGVGELGSFFAGIDDMSAAKIGASVIAALTWVEANPQYKSFGVQLSMVAMNLKNLK